MSTSLRELFESYKKWVSNNPMVAADVETSVKWISYFFAGRINNSGIVTELVYSLSNLLVLFNDQIISESRRTAPLAPGVLLKTWLTVLEYAEVFIEVSAKQMWGNKGKWLVILIIQIVKCIARMTLLFVHKEHIVQVPPIKPLQRKVIAAQDDMEPHPSTVGFRLKSGRIIRSIHSSSPTHIRSWKPPTHTTTQPDGSIPDKPLDRDLLIAEALYILKPVLHLSSVLRFGPKAWRPYLLSLAIDLLSLHIFRVSEKEDSGKMSPRQRMELSRREVTLLLYLLRSPFYDRYSRRRIEGMLYGLSNNLPLVGHLLKPLAQYLPHWQSMYFYMWSA